MSQPGPLVEQRGSAGTFLTDVTLEELERADATRRPEEFERTCFRAPKTPERTQSASVLADLSYSASKASELCQSASGPLLKARSRSLTSLTGRPGTSKAKDAILNAKAFSKSKKLKTALFQHKESNYYECLRVKPGNGWFRTLYEQVSTKNSRLTKSLLAVLDVAFVETLCVVNGTKMLVSNSESGLTVSIGEEAMVEFMQHAEAWSANGSQGCPIVVQKKTAGDPRKGCENSCVPMDFVDLRAAMQRLNAEEECVLFQRFVPPRVRGCPSLVRIAWRDSFAPRGFRLKSNATPEQLHAAGFDEQVARWTVSSCMPGTHATDLRTVPPSAFRIADQIAHFTQVVFGLQLTQLVVDCLQDEHGVYFFSQVKAFTAQPQWLRRIRSAAGVPPAEDWHAELRGAPAAPAAPQIADVPQKRSLSSSSKKPLGPTAACGMCTCSQPLNKMSKRMTPKMMLETEHHMRKRGVQLFHVARVRANSLSDLTPVCDACWSLYLAEAELCRAEVKLAKAVAIDISGAAADEAYVPFGGVLSSVRSSSSQADFGGLHKRRDPFRIHDPLPSQPQPQLSKNAAGLAQAGGDRTQWPSGSRRGGEAIAYSEDQSAQLVTLPVPQTALQWRMMIHTNRLMDIAPELRDLVASRGDGKRCGQGRLSLRVEVPWQPDTPLDIQLPPLGSQDELSIQRTAVHFIFSDPSSHHPLHAFLSQSKVRFSLLLSEAPYASLDALEGTPVSGSPRYREVLTGHLSLERMLESIRSGFLSQSWVMFCKDKDSKSQCQLKLTLGLVCDHTVSTEYVALRSYMDAFVPSRPYFSSEVLPSSWTATIQGDKSYMSVHARGLLSTGMIPREPMEAEEVEPDTCRSTAAAEAIQRGCSALLGSPLLLAPLPSSSA